MQNPLDLLFGCDYGNKGSFTDIEPSSTRHLPYCNITTYTEQYSAGNCNVCPLSKEDKSGDHSVRVIQGY
jgi:hypothetical protein